MKRFEFRKNETRNLSYLENILITTPSTARHLWERDFSQPGYKRGTLYDSLDLRETYVPPSQYIVQRHSSKSNLVFLCKFPLRSTEEENKISFDRNKDVCQLYTLWKEI